MDVNPATPSLAVRLAADLTLALIGQGVFAPGRPEGRQAANALYDSIARRLRETPQIALLAGRPECPADFLCWGFAAGRQELAGLLPAQKRSLLMQHLTGSWRERGQLFLSLRSGLERQEFERLLHLLAIAGSRGAALRNRCLEEQAQGGLAHVTLLLADDLRALDPGVAWPVQAALAWLQRDLNLLTHLDSLTAPALASRRRALLDAVLALVGATGELCELLAHLDLIVEKLHDYDRDEFAGLLLERLGPPTLSGVCFELCTLIERLQHRVDQAQDPAARERVEHVRWIARRVAEQLINSGNIAPAHYHALVLQKVLLYEEIPGAVRGRVAALQVLTSFLANPQRYLAEIEGSHSPEVLAMRLWRLLEMLPNMLRAWRFDVVREVVAFAQRFGPSFDLARNAELLTQVREAAAEVLTGGETAQQAELMRSLPQMGHSGLHLLIDLADHPNRSVRRSALDGLCAAGTVVVPVLFEALEHKPGWHYLRNMLVILGKVGAGGPKVEQLFRRCLEHAEPAVRKEALPGVARLSGTGAAGLVAARLADPDGDVRRQAVVCLGVTGVDSPLIYQQLAGFLTAKGGDDLALAVMATLNRLRPGAAAGPLVESALVELAGGGGWFGTGKGSHSRPLRLEAIRTLGQFPSGRVRKTLERLLKEHDAAVARAAQGALLAAS